MARRIVTMGLLVLVGLLVMLYLFPVGGRIWSERSVSAVALVAGGRRLETSNPHAIEDGLMAARMDRIWRVVRPNFPCRPATIEFQQGDGWVRTDLRCTNGLLFDYLPWHMWE